ncbi:MAG: tetratricopeptide repeat protein [Treponema sp.]|nr:tetratricopeptide repeat protein [Treponema sp.]
MKKLFGVSCILLISVLLFSCNRVSNQYITRLQRMEENVDKPTTIEEYKEAIEKYETRVKDIQLAQTQIGIWYKLLGQKYMDVTPPMYGEALKAFQEALNYYPSNPNLYYYVGICSGYMYHKEKDGTGNMEMAGKYLTLAENAYLRAIQLDDRFVNALYGLSIVYVYETIEPERAIPYLEKLLTIDTKHIDAMSVLATAYYLNGEFDKTLEILDKIIDTTKSAETKSIAEEKKKAVLEQTPFQ